MFSAGGGFAVKEAAEQVKRLERLDAGRQEQMARIRDVRDGNLGAIKPEIFSDEWPESIVSNLIDTTARDLARVVAPLPTPNCSSGKMRTNQDKKRASIKNKIASHYWEKSKLQVQMSERGADEYNSYGFVVMSVVPDRETKMPRIIIREALGSYFENDWMGVTHRYARKWRENSFSLAVKFPHVAGTLMRDQHGTIRDTELEVVEYYDDSGGVLYVPGKGNLVLAKHKNFIHRCPVQVAKRPNLNETRTQGQWDQVLWLQLARAKMALYTMDAAEKSINAPLQVAKDANRIQLGPGAVIRTDHPVQRVPLNVPNDVFAQEQRMQQEQMLGSGMPEGRQGIANANIITGRGVEAMMGGFNATVQEAQAVIGESLAMVTEMCFEMQDRLWPTERYEIAGILTGETYEVSYTPKNDIAGNYEVDVTYGFASGQSPYQALIMLLQMKQAGAVDMDTLRRNMPFNVDVEHIQRAVDVEKLEEAMVQGLQATVQAIGPMIQSGQNPSQILQAAAFIADGRKQGKNLTDLFIEAFQPPEEEQGQPSPEEQLMQALGMGGGGGLPGGPDEGGLMPGVAYGQQGLPPGGMPTVQTITSGMRAGRPVADATTTSRTAV